MRKENEKMKIRSLRGSTKTFTEENREENWNKQRRQR